MKHEKQEQVSVNRPVETEGPLRNRMCNFEQPGLTVDNGLADLRSYIVEKLMLVSTEADIEGNAI